jgi:hypothetical protein
MKKEKIAKEKYLNVAIHEVASPFECKMESYTYMRLLHTQ